MVLDKKIGEKGGEKKDTRALGCDVQRLGGEEGPVEKQEKGPLAGRRESRKLCRRRSLQKEVVTGQSAVGLCQMLLKSL